jgi:hypothetical protein
MEDIMKNILDDWDDERCVTIFKNCQSLMTEKGKVLMAESGILPSTGSLT